MRHEHHDFPCLLSHYPAHRLTWNASAVRRSCAGSKRAQCKKNNPSNRRQCTAIIGYCSKRTHQVISLENVKKQVVPGFEPGLFGSEPKVMTTTLYNLWWMPRETPAAIWEKHFTFWCQKRKVVPGFEPGLFGSEPKVITTTLYNLWCDEKKRAKL